MSLLSNKAQADASLQVLFVAPPERDKSRRKWADKELAKESGAIISELTRTGEVCLVLAHDARSGMVVVTDQRTFILKRGRIRKQLRHEEVAETMLGTMPNGSTIVTIESIESRLDYSPTDAMRYEKVINVEVATPRIGNIICAHVDHHISA
jgi:hypothetical protein